ncbi:MAG: diphthamide synthesis protein [Nanoarchaeota archaeon]
MYKYDLSDAIKRIKDASPKRVLVQLPDGLKPKAKDIQQAIERETGVQVFLWAGSCYGSCDIPMGVERVGVDMILHFGHTPWRA